MATEHFTQCGCPCQGVTVQKVLAAEMPLELKKKKKKKSTEIMKRDETFSEASGECFLNQLSFSLPNF